MERKGEEEAQRYECVARAAGWRFGLGGARAGRRRERGRRGQAEMAAHGGDEVLKGGGRVDVAGGHLFVRAIATNNCGCDRARVVWRRLTCSGRVCSDGTSLEGRWCDGGIRVARRRVVR